MKHFVLIPLLLMTVIVSGQITKNRSIAWFLPSTNTRINGLAAGLTINNFHEEHIRVLCSEVNGICLEIIGAGFIVPLRQGHPIFDEPAEFYEEKENVDSLIEIYNSPRYRINGIAISAFGVGGGNVQINGLNLSGVNAETSKVNGISTGILFNLSGIVKGVSIGGFMNNTLVTRGLQVGFINETKQLRGIQLGLWNKNEKRTLPFINWNFR